MDWKNATTEPPPLATRVLVETEHGSHLFAKRVRNSRVPGEYWYIDDQSLPIKYAVIRWTSIVAGDETGA